MAQHRPNVPPKTKEALQAEAGGKCANPGCPNTRTHLHHSQDWAAYQTHDQRHMIAICPACHDAVHHGSLTIADGTLYRWKSIVRGPDASLRGHLYVEPPRSEFPLIRLQLGSIAVGSFAPLNVFELSANNVSASRLKAGTSASSR